LPLLKKKLIKLLNYSFLFIEFIQINILNKKKKIFIDLFSLFKSKSLELNKDGIILVEMVENFEFAFKIASASYTLANKYNYKVSIYDCNWNTRLNKPNFQKWLNCFGLHSIIQKVYLAFGDQIIFSNSNLYYNQNLIHHKSDQIFASLIKTSDILDIKFDGVIVGDLIYDTYLRYYHEPTITKLDQRLKFIIRVSLDIYYSFCDLLDSQPIKVLIQSYTSYITHGICSRIALHKGLKVYCISSDAYIIQEAKLDFPYHGINHTKFLPENDISTDKLHIAESLLTKRFEGGIDEATSYMKQSSFFQSNKFESLKLLFNKQNRNIVIYAHDFYDSPHINRLLQFDDLFKFLDETLFFLNNLSDVSVFIKIHPNGILGADDITIKLVQKYNNNNFYILDANVSNLDIIKLKPDIIGTARGTVGIEMSYFEIPVVALFDNIYCNYNFVHTCKSVIEYFNILSGNSNYKIDYNKKNIYNFYYKAYLEQKELDTENVLNKIKVKEHDTYTVGYIVEFLKRNDNKIVEELINLYQKAISLN